MPGLDSLSDDELEAVASGNLDGLSDAALEVVASYSPEPQKPSPILAGIGETMFGVAAPLFRSDVSPKRALLTNEPTSGITEDVIRGLPATGGAIIGAAGGAGLGSIPLAAVGGAGGEGLRQTMVQSYANLQNKPMTPAGEVFGRMGGQGLAQGLGQGLGVGVNYAIQGAKAGFPVLAKISANVDENLGQAATKDLDLLGRAPSEAEVTTAYDKFHRASGTVSRKEAIAASDDPFDTVSRAMGTMRDAYNKLRGKTLSFQEAVEASQAARIIRDMKSRGVEIAQEVSGAADNLKGLFDDFIEKGIGPRTEIQSVPVAQELVKSEVPIASKIVPQSDVFPAATTLIPESVNVPTSQAQNILPELKRIVSVINNARANGVPPTSVMTQAEKELYSRFGAALESAAEHRVPLETLLTQSEMTTQIPGFAERTVFRPGETIMQGQNRMAFGGTVTKPSYSPGDVIMGNRPVQVPARAGYPEWQTARQAAFERTVADEFGNVVPRNVNQQPNVLRTWSAMGGGATTGGTIGAVLGGPLGAAVGAGLGAIGGGATVSPLAYGLALRAAGVAAKVPAGVYQVPARAAVSGTGSALSDQYMQRRYRVAP